MLPAQFRIGDLRQSLIANKASWTINPRLRDTDPIPTFSTGSDKTALQPAPAVPAIDFKQLLSDMTANPFLRQQQINRGFLPPTANMPLPVAGLSMPSAGGPQPQSRPTAVDWRNRWGWAWVTAVRDQNPCESCWAFACTAMVESMVRVEHCVWAVLSEGDVHQGIGAHCSSLGNSDATLNWMRDHGLADPGCFAWTTADVRYTPTSDRAGRTVRLPSYTNVGSVEDQKNWLDTVGPLVCFYAVYQDFFAYGGGVYRKQATINGQPNTLAGYHLMEVVGYDDHQSCWIVKNSWGTGWGEAGPYSPAGQGGFARIGYGECEIDSYAKQGLRGTNPDPWTKRRLHGGNILESGNGAAHRNFEMLATYGNQVRHWWRNNQAAGLPWAAAYTFGTGDATVCPTHIATTYNRNFECVYLTTGRRLHHWWFNQASPSWNDGGIFGPTDAAGVPGFIQGNYGAPGNFEVVVRTLDGRLNHWWRDGGFHWHDGGRFGSGVAYSGPSLLQSQFGQKGNLELVCVLNGGQMQHWWRDNDHGLVWNAAATFGSGVASPPCMIESSYGAPDEKRPGNFELCVAVGGQVQHWWRNNAGDGQWRQSATFGHNVLAVAGLVQGSFGFNLEAVVLRTDRQLQHYWRDGGGWHEGVVIGPT